MSATDHQIDYTARHPRLIACDSDGCAFDVMDLKHKECFCPAFIKHFGLQRCARQARQVWEFVNLYSRTRGCNRFIAVGHAVKLLAEHPEVCGTGITFMDFEPVHTFLTQTKALGEPELERQAKATDAPALHAMLAWTREVNVAVKAMCQGLGPFPGVDETLRAASESCDVLVVSQAPRPTLLHEWTESGLAAHTNFIAGQEFGDKASQVAQALAAHPQTQAVLVLGDAPGDQQAAEAAEACFFPIVPGDEIASWKRLREDGLPRFLKGEFDATYQASLLDTFSRALPTTPPWQTH